MRRALVAALLLLPRVANAEDCPRDRPTDPAGYAGITYGSAVAKSFVSEGTGAARIHYVETGPHAPVLTSTRSDGVPDRVARAGAIIEEAIAGFAKKGYRKPPSDGDYAACASNGGDGKIDVYLVDMKGSDGLATRERCVAVNGAEVCTGAILVENGYEARGYKDYDEGARTVIPHEYFHLVQNGYDARIDRWWAEGTAQWATKQLHPDLEDLERFLPSFFAELDRPIDSPPGGATAAFLYGSALFPQYLGEAHAPGLIVEVFNKLDGNNGAVLPSLESVLNARSNALPDAFAAFASWNAATGSRAGEAGYRERAKYPEAEVAATEPLPFRVAQLFAGFASKYFRVEEPAELALEGDPSRVGALALSLVDGKVDLASARALPTRTAGPSIVVVTGRSAAKTDVTFVLSGTVPAVVEDAGSDLGAQPPSSDGDGCAYTGARSDPYEWLPLIVGVVGLSCLRRRRQRSPTRSSLMTSRSRVAWAVSGIGRHHTVSVRLRICDRCAPPSRSARKRIIFSRTLQRSSHT